jgi:hypothetical protein
MRRARPSAVRARPRRESFSIVEILVVVGIISVLIAILFPALAKARRSALVLACPIAYVGQDGGLYLTNENGTAELRISPPGWRVESRQGLESPMAWSPSGLTLAFQFYNPATSEGGWVLMDVMSGQGLRPRGRRPYSFGGWIDNDTYLGSGAYFHNVLSVHTGDPVSSFRLPDDRHYDAFARVPRTCDGAFIASFHGDSPSHIALVGRDYQPRKPVYTGPAVGTHHHHVPLVDPSGEWVAWSYSGALYLHSVRGSSRVPATPVRMPPPYSSPEFCDWTENGRLLVNAALYGGQQALVVLETDGRLVRQISTTTPPAPGSVAAYRKYEHR